jgi:hypothetical protein
MYAMQRLALKKGCAERKRFFPSKSSSFARMDSLLNSSKSESSFFPNLFNGASNQPSDCLYVTRRNAPPAPNLAYRSESARMHKPKTSLTLGQPHKQTSPVESFCVSLATMTAIGTRNR